MRRTRLAVAAAVPAWAVAALGVLTLGAGAEPAARCPLDGPWG